MTGSSHFTKWVGEFALVYGHRVRLRFTIPFTVTVHVALWGRAAETYLLTAVPLVVVSWLMGAGLCVWWWRRQEDYTRRYRGLYRDVQALNEAMERGSRGGLGAMAVAVGDIPDVVDAKDYIRAIRALERKWGVSLPHP